MQPEGFLAGLLEKAKQNLAEEDFLLPTLLMFSKGSIEVYGMDDAVWGPSSRDRYETLYRLGATMGYGNDAESIVVICDAYMKSAELPKGTTKEEAKKLGLTHGSLRNDPEAREAIIIIELAQNLDSRMIFCCYDKHEVAGKLTYTWDIEETMSTDEPEKAAFAYSYQGFWDGFNKTAKLVETLLAVAPTMEGYTPERLEGLRSQLKETCLAEGRQFLQEVTPDATS